MTNTFRAMCAELLAWADHASSHYYIRPALFDRARALLAQPEPEGLTDEDLLELMPQQFRDDLATVSRTAAHGAGPDITPGIFRVSLNTGALDYARAAIAADRARRPTSQPPADGEVGELVEWLQAMRELAGEHNPDEQRRYARAADLLERLASPSYVLDADTGAIASLKAAGPGRVEALPVLMPAAQPVAVSERPWEREGWCDDEGRCWMGDPGGGEFIPSWRLCRPDDAPNMKVSLSANALPLPQGHDN